MFPNFVLLLLLNTQGEILLLRRINTPFCNQCYALPGGKIERGETAREALIREAKNSLALTINSDELQFVHIMYRKCNEPEFFACVFQMHIKEEVPYNKEPERHDDIQWFSIDRLPDNIVPAHRHAIALIQKHIFYSEHGWHA